MTEVRLYVPPRSSAIRLISPLRRGAVVCDAFWMTRCPPLSFSNGSRGDSGLFPYATPATAATAASRMLTISSASSRVVQSGGATPTQSAPGRSSSPFSRAAV